VRLKPLQDLLRHQADIAQRISDTVCHRRGDFTDGGKPLGLHQLTLRRVETGIHVFEGSGMPLQVVILPIDGPSRTKNHASLPEKQQPPTGQHSHPEPKPSLSYELLEEERMFVEFEHREQLPCVVAYRDIDRGEFAIVRVLKLV